jgi:transcriptional regulator with XRE-family HTH domain
MQVFRFHERLHREFSARRKRNRRYSLRAFAASLGADHSTLSQILRGERRVPAGRIPGWGAKLGIGEEEIAAYIAAEELPDASRAEQQDRLRNWIAEAMAVVNEPAHLRILELCRTKDFRSDTRWVAERIGASVDEVNLAWSRLLRLRLMLVTADGNWKDVTGLPQLTEGEFRRLALAQVRRLAHMEGL